MERQKLVILSIVCTLLFSCGSIASTHVYSQDVSEQSVLAQLDHNGIDFADTLATIGIPETNGVTEFARQVSGIQHELDFGGGQTGESNDARHFPRVTPSRHDMGAFPAKNSSMLSGESGTLILITLGFAALGLSRRRIKFATFADANGGLSSTSQNNAINIATATSHDHVTSRLRHPRAGAQTISATANDSGEEIVKAPQAVKTAAISAAADRNPFPELAQSVQKLEALAREMADLR